MRELKINPLRVVPLGGLGEIGQNMMVLEYDDDIVVIDAGVLFPDVDMPGIDFAVPDITYLLENRDRVRAILITHGHEDHIGALPFVLAELDVPVYASRLAHGLITVKLRERGVLPRARLNLIEPNSPFRLGAFSVEFFRVCHSIPDAMGLAITTPLGLVIHTGDFKIDHTPADGRATDFSALSKLTADSVLLMFSDSTYAEMEGYTTSEQVVGEALDRVIGEAEGRVMVATFASLISRVQQIFDAAVKHGRVVTLAGRSMHNNVHMALSMGYLTAPQGTLVSMRQARRLPNERVVIVATGAQGEPTSALVRIANRKHQDIEVIPGDTVVISASPIPGNETLVAKTIDNLFRQGANVLYTRIAMVHVHGHASREELKMMISLVRPRFFVPVHGEYRHLVAHSSLAQSMGIPKSNIFVLEDGDVLELDGEQGKVVDRVEAGHIFVDGRRMWDMRSGILDERRRLAREGIVAVVITLNKGTGAVLKPPGVVSSGFVEIEESQELFEKASNVALAALERKRYPALEWAQIESEIADAVSDVLHDGVGRRPTVLTVVEEV